MCDLNNTTDRNEVWQFMTGVINYLDDSLTFVTQDELRKILSSKGVTNFSGKLLMSMVTNGNIACYEATDKKGEKVRYFCSTKYARFVPGMSE